MALVLNLLLVVGLAYVGVTAHSLGVLAAGVDYLADVVAIGKGHQAAHLRATPIEAITEQRRHSGNKPPG